MKVPTIDQPQVNQAGLPDARVSLDYSGTNGEAVDRGLQHLGQGGEQLAQHVDRAMDMAAEVEATNAHTQFIHDATSAMHGTSAEAQKTPSAQLAGVPGSGAEATTGSGGVKSAAGGGDPGASTKPAEIPTQGQLNAQGMAAVAASGHTLEYLGNRRDEIAAGLSPRAQQRFLESSGPQLEAFRSSIEDHTNQQIRVVAAESLKAFGATGLTTIANHYTLAPGDEAIVQSTLDAQAKRIQAMGQQQGMPPEVISAQVERYRQDANATRLNQLLAADDYEGAGTLFNRADVKDHLDPDARAHFADRIKTKTDRQEAESLAQEIYDNAHDEDTGLTNIATMDESFLARSPEEKDRTQAAFSRNKAIAQSQNEATAATYFNRAMSKFTERHSLADINSDDVTWLQKNDAHAWDTLQKEELSWRASMQRGTGGGRDKNELNGLQLYNYSQAIDQIRSAPPETLKDWTPEKIMHDFYGHLPQKYLLDIVNLASERRGQKPAGGGGGGDGLVGVEHDIILQKLHESNVLKPGDKSNLGGWTADAARIHAWVVDDIAKKKAAFVASGKKPGLEDIERWAAADLTHRVLVGHRLLGMGDVRVPYADYQSNPAYSGTPVLNEPGEVPHEDAEQIREAFAEQGKRPPTDDQIKQKYDELRTQRGNFEGEEVVGSQIPSPTKQPPPAAAPAGKPPPPAAGPAAPPSQQVDTTSPISRSILGLGQALYDSARTGAQITQDRQAQRLRDRTDQLTDLRAREDSGASAATARRKRWDETPDYHHGPRRGGS